MPAGSFDSAGFDQPTIPWARARLPPAPAALVLGWRWRRLGRRRRWRRRFRRLLGRRRLVRRRRRLGKLVRCAHEAQGLPGPARARPHRRGHPRGRGPLARRGARPRVEPEGGRRAGGGARPVRVARHDRDGRAQRRPDLRRARAARRSRSSATAASTSTAAPPSGRTWRPPCRTTSARAVFTDGIVKGVDAHGRGARREVPAHGSGRPQRAGGRRQRGLTAVGFRHQRVGPHFLGEPPAISADDESLRRRSFSSYRFGAASPVGQSSATATPSASARPSSSTSSPRTVRRRSSRTGTRSTSSHAAYHGRTRGARRAPVAATGPPA